MIPRHGRLSASDVRGLSFCGESQPAPFGEPPTVLAPGDRLAIVNQDPADATLADLSITLKGNR
jgi:hypothetical protein